MKTSRLCYGARCAALILSSLIAPSLLVAEEATPNRIQPENGNPGSTDWQLTRVRLDRSDGCRSSAIEGYCSKQSVAAGETIEFMVPTDPAEKFQLEIFRTGYYGGDYRWAELREETNGPFPHRGPDEGYLMGARNLRPVNGGGDWICTNPEHWVFAGTGMKAGDRVPGLIGWEFHCAPPTDLPGLEILAQGTAWQGGTNPAPWTATIYPGPKNNYVFNAATIFWSQGLSMPPGHTLPWSHGSRPHGPDSRVQQITHNLLDRAIAPSEDSPAQ